MTSCGARRLAPGRGGDQPLPWVCRSTIRSGRDTSGWFATAVSNRSPPVRRACRCRRPRGPSARRSTCRDRRRRWPGRRSARGRPRRGRGRRTRRPCRAGPRRPVGPARSSRPGGADDDRPGALRDPVEEFVVDVTCPGDDLRPAVGQRRGEPAGHLGGGPGIVLTRHRQGPYGDGAQVRGEVGVRRGEHAVAVERWYDGTGVTPDRQSDREHHVVLELIPVGAHCWRGCPSAVRTRRRRLRIGRVPPLGGRGPAFGLRGAWRGGLRGPTGEAYRELPRRKSPRNANRVY